MTNPSTRCLAALWLALAMSVVTAASPLVAAGGLERGPGGFGQPGDDRRQQRQERRADRQQPDRQQPERQQPERQQPERQQARGTVQQQAARDGRQPERGRDRAKARRAERQEQRTKERQRERRAERRAEARDEAANNDDDDDDTDVDDTDDDDSDDDDAPYESPVIDDDDDPTTDGFRSQQAIVRLTPGADITAFSQRHTAAVGAAIPAQDLYLITFAGGARGQVDLQPLRDDQRTVWVELNYAQQAPEGRPGRFFLSAEAVSPTQAEAAAPAAVLRIPEARGCASGAGVMVAVLDTGVDAAHPALAGQIVAGGRNMLTGTPDASDVGNGLDDDGDGFIDEMTGHGTHVAGIIAQVAPGAGILPVKVLDSDGLGDAFYVAAGIYHAIERGADMINLSLGSTHDARVVAEAVRAAHDAGIVVIAAAGNADRDRPPEFPATDEHAFGIAATDANDRKSAFSNYHDDLLLSAPGIDIISAFPGGGYAVWSGTSMATPWVTGAAALLREVSPGLEVEDIGERLEATADPIPDHDSRYDGLLGDGRLDVGAAVDCSD